MFSKYFTKLSVRLAKFALNRADLAVSDRLELTNCVMHNLAALPLSDILSYSTDGRLLLRGKLIDLETLKKLRESAKGALNSYAMDFIYDQVTYEALKMGMTTVTRIEETFFGKAALWWREREIHYLNLFAGE